LWCKVAGVSVLQRESLADQIFPDRTRREEEEEEGGSYVSTELKYQQRAAVIHGATSW
jgi:hypothetical protein